MAIQEIRVTEKFPQQDSEGKRATAEASFALGQQVNSIEATKVYRFQGITVKQAAEIANKFLAEPLTQDATVNKRARGRSRIREVGLKPGVMNPQVESIQHLIELAGIKADAVDTSTEYKFPDTMPIADVKVAVHRLYNPTVEQVIEKKPKTIKIDGEPGKVESIAIAGMNRDGLKEVSNRLKLHLNDNELSAIQEHYKKLGRNPTDAELMIFGAGWSEHCVHKTFKSELMVNGEKKASLFKRIKDTAAKYIDPTEVPSAFVDNAGVYAFYDGMAICIKLETHNSPSAIEPYGGAATGVGGVLRDIMGTGKGAKNILSIDIFCFAPEDMDPELLPEGCLDPKYLKDNCIRGVGDYGNRMGVPTTNGSFHYDNDFRAKPTVMVGAVGILPMDQAKKGEPQLNDYVVTIGGKTGRDGIGGATFSSVEMTDKTITVDATSVQIGNAIEEKRTADAILELRDAGMIRAITDCGAAGFASAIGEMGSGIGVTIDLAKAPTKYPGLSPAEIMLSESQERMVIAVDPNNIEKFNEICKRHGVESAILGHFDGSNKLNVSYDDQFVAEIDYDFLNDGIPLPTLEAEWTRVESTGQEPEAPTDWVDAIKKVLTHGNVKSHEEVVRKYDHGVQGTNALYPFTGVEGDGPNDAGVLKPIADKDYGVLFAHGLNPKMTRIDPYKGTKWAAVEALSNIASVGGKRQDLVLTNNFVSPVPDRKWLGSLDKQVDAICDIMDAMERPIVSGKDSLSATYTDKKTGQKIEAPPVVCISALGKVENVEKTISSDIKKEGSTLVLIGKADAGMAGSTYYDIHGVEGNNVPDVDLEAFKQTWDKLYSAIDSEKVLSCHDISEGGVIGAVAEMCFGGGVGVDIQTVEFNRPEKFWFNETVGQFVVEIDNPDDIQKLFGEIPHMILGQTTNKAEIKVKSGNNELFTAPLSELKNAWKGVQQAT